MSNNCIIKRKIFIWWRKINLLLSLASWLVFLVLREKKILYSFFSLIGNGSKPIKCTYPTLLWDFKSTSSIGIVFHKGETRRGYIRDTISAASHLLHSLRYESGKREMNVDMLRLFSNPPSRAQDTMNYEVNTKKPRKCQIYSELHLRVRSIQSYIFLIFYLVLED